MDNIQISGRNVNNIIIKTTNNTAQIILSKSMIFNIDFIYVRIGEE